MAWGKASVRSRSPAGALLQRASERSAARERGLKGSCSLCRAAQIMEIASFEKFLVDKIKVNNKTGEQLGGACCKCARFTAGGLAEAGRCRTACGGLSMARGTSDKEVWRAAAEEWRLIGAR
jgi:hypothetical protein